MTNTINIAVDAGKYNTKAVCKINNTLRTIHFRSKMQPIENFGGELTPNNYLVEQYDKSFLIGDMVSEDTTNYNLTKQNDEFKYCVYLAICCFLKKLNTPSHMISNINLAINMPLTLFKNQSHKVSMQEFIQNQGKPIQLKVNDTLYSFKLCNVTIIPEAVGPIYTNVTAFRNKRATVIDIGSLNVSYTTYNNLSPTLESMTTSNNGINILRSKIAETLTSKYNTLVNDTDVEYILRTDKFLYLEGVKQIESNFIIEQLLSEHTKGIFSYAKSRGFTFNNVDVVFCGGGSILLKEYLLNEFPTASIEPESQFSNVYSFYKILEAKYGQA